MTETSLEKLVEERQFAGLLQTNAEVFFRLSNSLLDPAQGSWNKRHYFQLISESDSLETFLDDYGARYNRTYSFFREVIASLRWFAHAGYSITHLLGRLDTYGAVLWDDDAGHQASQRVTEGLEQLRGMAVRLLEAARAEAQRLGLELTPEAFPEQNFVPVSAKRSLPRNVGEDELVNEDQKIAEVATKFLQAAEMIAGIGVREIKDGLDRHRFFGRVCTEELARVYEATVHNLQSTYDTHIQNTVLEGNDQRLPQLRGRVSAALHGLQAVTHLAHFIERHENEVRNEEARRGIFELVDRSEIEHITLNVFLLFAHNILQGGVALASDLLPEYTNIQQLEVTLTDDLSLHARPAALVVSIVNQYGTPVEMEIEDQRCNAGSILELLVAVGSQPDTRHFIFRGDERPLRDIALLFEHGLGESGLDGLPDELDYLRQN